MKIGDLDIYVAVGADVNKLRNRFAGRFLDFFEQLLAFFDIVSGKQFANRRVVGPRRTGHEAFRPHRFATRHFDVLVEIDDHRQRLAKAPVAQWPVLIVVIKLDIAEGA